MGFVHAEPFPSRPDAACDSSSARRQPQREYAGQALLRFIRTGQAAAAGRPTVPLTRAAAALERAASLPLANPAETGQMRAPIN